MRLSLPIAITEQCYPSMTEDQSNQFYTAFQDAKAQEDEINASTGGLRAIDIYTTWTSYVELGRFICS